MIAPNFGRLAAVTYDEYPAAYSRSENEFIGRSPEYYIFNHISDLEKFSTDQTIWRQSSVSASSLPIERELTVADKFETVLGGVNSTGK